MTDDRTDDVRSGYTIRALDESTWEFFPGDESRREGVTWRLIAQAASVGGRPGVQGAGG